MIELVGVTGINIMHNSGGFYLPSFEIDFDSIVCGHAFARHELEVSTSTRDEHWSQFWQDLGYPSYKGTVLLQASGGEDKYEFILSDPVDSIPRRLTLVIQCDRWSASETDKALNYSSSDVLVYSFTRGTDTSTTDCTTPAWSGLSDVESRGSEVFATSDKGLFVFDIQTPASPQFVSFVKSEAVTDLYVTICDSTHVCVYPKFWQMHDLQIIDVSNRRQPQLCGRYVFSVATADDDPARLLDLASIDRTIYALIGTTKKRYLQVLTTVDYSSITLSSSIELSRKCDRIAVNDRIFAVAGDDGLFVYDRNALEAMTSGAKPLSGDKPLKGRFTGILVLNDSTIVGIKKSALEVIHSDGPTLLTVGKCKLESETAYYYKARGNLVIVDQDIVDCSILERPVLQSSYFLFDDPLSIAGQYACVATPLGLDVYDISDPTKPVSVGKYDEEVYRNLTDPDRINARRLVQSAEAGDLQAQYELGWCYAEGRGVETDAETARMWIRKAADGGFAKAEYDLFLYGLETFPVDTSANFQYCRRAADHGSIEAEYALGKCYLTGYGLSIDTAQAEAVFQRLAQTGDPDAMVQLFDLRQEKARTASDTADVLSWARQAASHMSPAGQYRLGLCYFDGFGVQESVTEAVRLIRFAADKGYAFAQTELGICYDEGRGVEQDKAEAMKWLQKAADQNDLRARGLILVHQLRQQDQ